MKTDRGSLVCTKPVDIPVQEDPIRKSFRTSVPSVPLVLYFPIIGCGLIPEMSDCDDKAAGIGDAEKLSSASNATEQCTDSAPEQQTTIADAPGSDPCSDPDYAGGDLQERYRELCRRTSECKSYFRKLTECNERVNSRTKTEEKCVEEVIDYFHCVDHCAAKRFFKLLK